MTEVSGRLVARERGNDLVLVRSLALPIDEAWHYLTDPSETEHWFGPWEGDARTGGAIRVRMRFEESEPAIKMRVRVCQPPVRLSLLAVDEYASWDLDLLLEEDGEYDTLATLVHHLGDDVDLGDVGPGWEYYLDLLVAATEGTERPGFDQYYPELRDAYLGLRP